MYRLKKRIRQKKKRERENLEKQLIRGHGEFDFAANSYAYTAKISSAAV